jgi:hypothetical protein
VHFLANSVLGPSLYIPTPSKFKWTLVATQDNVANKYMEHYGYSGNRSLDVGCWTAFRANSYVLPQSMDAAQGIFTNSLGDATTFASAEIFHTSNCTQL